MTVPIATRPGRSGFGPQLSLSYDSGAGNGPFGFGWSLSLNQKIEQNHQTSLGNTFPKNMRKVIAVLANDRRVRLLANDVALFMTRKVLARILISLRRGDRIEDVIPYRNKSPGRIVESSYSFIISLRV